MFPIARRRSYIYWILVGVLKPLIVTPALDSITGRILILMLIGSFPMIILGS